MNYIAVNYPKNDLASHVF